MTKYFSRLPVIMYNGMFARNLLTRVQFAKETRANTTIFYPYQMKEADARLDIVSDKYYKDSDYAWLIAMTNNMLDPYYEAGLTSETLDDFVKAKYGSINEALERIVYWRNDWESDDSSLSPSTFNNLLPGQKKYYNGILGYNGMVSGYERKQEDWVVETNSIVTLSISANTIFPVDARVTTDSNSTGTVCFCNSSILTLKHIQGVIANSTIVSSNSNTVAVNSIVHQSFSIDPSESQYWSPVSAYDYEQDQNAERRNITLLDNRLTSDVIKEMTDLL